MPGKYHRAVLFVGSLGGVDNTNACYGIRMCACLAGTIIPGTMHYSRPEG